MIGPQPQPMQVGDVGDKESKRKSKIIIFASSGIGFVVVVVVLAIVLPKIFVNNPIAGEWDCHKFSWSGDATDEPVNKLILNTDGSFMYGSYGDLNNNHFAGGHTNIRKKGRTMPVDLFLIRWSLAQLLSL